MKNISLSIIAFLVTFIGVAQNNLEDLIAAGIQDAQRFATSYISPGTESMVHNMSNGWIQSAEVKKQFHFDISLMGNVTFINDKHQSFTLNTTEYNNLKFRDGSISKEVATIFGENDPDIMVYSVVSNNGFSEEVEFYLPQGLASVDLNILPTAYLQARVGILKGTELKLRYFPKIDREDVKVGLYGAALQHEFTTWLPAEKLFPVAISGIIAYTSVSANYNFTNHQVVSGTDQRFDLDLSSWLFQVQASTKWKIINLYGGLGFVSGKSDFDVLGNYKVEAGIPLLETTREFKDPFSVRNKVSGVRGTVGAELRLGFFGLHVDYNLAEYNNATVGLHFGY